MVKERKKADTLIGVEDNWYCKTYPKNFTYDILQMEYDYDAHNAFVNYLEGKGEEPPPYDMRGLYMCGYDDLDCPVYLKCFNYIYSSAEKYINLTVFTYEDICLWLNGKIIYNYSGSFSANFLVQLQPGLNVFCIDLFSIQNAKGFEIHFFTETCPLPKDSYISYLNDNYWANMNNCMFVKRPLDYVQQPYLEFAIYPCDYYHTNVKKGYTLEVFQYISECGDEFTYEDTTPLVQLQGQFGNVQTIDLDEVRSKMSPCAYVAFVNVTFYNEKGEPLFFREYFLLKDTSKYIEKIKEALKHIQEQSLYSDYDRWFRNSYLTNEITNFWDADYAQKLVVFNKKGQSIEDYYTTTVLQPNKKIIIFSALDNTYQNFYYTLPKNYDKNKKYPLFIICASYYQNYYSYHFAEQDEYIVADISGRGVLTGSYMNETQFMESLQHVLRLCSVDLNRIYITGFSNGAYTVWSLLENYPNIFAAAMPVSGIPIKNGMQKLRDIDIITVSSDKDLLYNATYAYPLEHLEPYGHIYGEKINSVTHNLLFNSMFSKRLIDWLLSYKREHTVTLQDFNWQDFDFRERSLGIAEAYLHPLLICNNGQENNTVANTFAHPVSNGYLEKLFVDYPIKQHIDGLDKRKSVIFIDMLGSNTQLDPYRQLLPVQCTEEGLRYQDIIYNGDYCVIQLIRNPHNEKNCFIAVQANSSKARKNILLRRFTLSSYSNGFNPYINGEIVIYINGQYFYTEKTGGRLKKINT